jgi:hypothetical protein
VPPNLSRCFLLNGLQRPSRATLLPPGRVRPESSRCSTSRTACDLPVHQFGRGLSASSGNIIMRCTPPLCTSLPCIAPPFLVAGPTFRSGLAASQVPPRPSSPSYRRARPRCPPCGSASSRHASALSAHLCATSAVRCHASTRADPSLQRLMPHRSPAQVQPPRSSACTLARCMPSAPARAATSRQHLPPRPFRRCRASAPSRTTFARAALHCAQHFSSLARHAWAGAPPPARASSSPPPVFYSAQASSARAELRSCACR